MQELIDRQVALAEIDDTIAGSLDRPEDPYIDKGLMMARRLIEKLPTIEPEVRHGHWMFLEQKSGYLWKCSNCKGNFDQQFSYCPHCGANMEG